MVKPLVNHTPGGPKEMEARHSKLQRALGGKARPAYDSSKKLQSVGATTGMSVAGTKATGNSFGKPSAGKFRAGRT